MSLIVDNVYTVPQILNNVCTVTVSHFQYTTRQSFRADNMYTVLLIVDKAVQ